MGSYDGAELCELIEIYIQSFFINTLSKDTVGLCREDGLFTLRKINKKQTEGIRKKKLVFSKISTLQLKLLPI